MEKREGLGRQVGGNKFVRHVITRVRGSSLLHRSGQHSSCAGAVNTPRVTEQQRRHPSRLDATLRGAGDAATRGNGGNPGKPSKDRA